MKYYAGIGSRETPKQVLDTFTSLGCWFAKKGLVLRSGHADGADKAFEDGCDIVQGSKEIYLPWSGFNGSNSMHIFDHDNEALALAKKYHPAFDRLSQGAQKLQARNSYQVLGADLKTPSSFIVCWTPEGRGSGGTGQAIRIAHAYNIPVFDFGGFGSIVSAKEAFNQFYKEHR